MNINFKLLGVFLSVAENASFRKAADQTNRSMPAVSMQIKQLEAQVGVALFQRTTRKVSLTDEGEKLLISARKALAELENGLSQIQHSIDLQHGRLSFACVPTVASTRLPLILTTFAKKYPGITVHVRELANLELLDCVRRREVDFGIGPMPENKGELDFLPIFVDEYCAMLPKGYQDKGRAGISLRELCTLPLLMLSDASTFRAHVEKALSASGLEAKSNYEFAHVNTLIAMAEAGLGVALLPRVAIPRKTQLEVVRVVNPALSRTIAIATIRGHTLSPSASRLVELFSQLSVPPPKK